MHINDIISIIKLTIVLNDVIINNIYHMYIDIENDIFNSIYINMQILIFTLKEEGVIMCGIVGYVGTGYAKERVSDGLKRLEYRGYDSAGIAMPVDGKIEIRKTVGEIVNLEKIIAEPEFDAPVAIGHTRWATHGAPSTVNFHPHGNTEQTIAIVHNGIIENYQEIREYLQTEYGVHFASETDSEVIAHLIGLYYDGDLHQAVNKAVEQMRGTIALMDRETLVFALATQDFLYEKMVSNIVEVQARGARIISLAKEGHDEIEKVSNKVIYIPDCADDVAPVLAVVPLQIFAYYVAKELGCNIDKPKNLAKSVTVE